MAVDVRATIGATIGNCISGQLSNNHISDGSGLIITTGRLIMEGSVTPARGEPVELVIATPQNGLITRFPRPLHVLRAVANVMERTSEIEVGDRLALMRNKKDAILYFGRGVSMPEYDSLTVRQSAIASKPLRAQNILRYCLRQIGIPYSDSSVPLQFQFLRQSIDLSAGYVQIIGDLVRSESCFGHILPNGRFEVQKINYERGRYGPILRPQNLISIEAITSGQEPPDIYQVEYRAAERVL
jgi:hypothetical protein